MEKFTYASIVGFAVVAMAVGSMGISSCTYQSDALSAVECDEPGAQSGDRECRDGYWVIIGDDVSDTEDVCHGESESQLCDHLEVECGSHTTQDRCGESRTIQCGGCSNGDYCADGTCLAPTCDDGVQNGDETDVDCGGDECEPCEPGQGCQTPGDCTTRACGMERSIDGLVALYTFDDGTGQSVQDRGADYVEAANDLGAVLVYGNEFADTQFIDQSGNGHHGTRHGGTEFLDYGGPTSDLLHRIEHRSNEDSFTEIEHHDDLSLDEAMTIAYWRRHNGDWDDEIGTDLSKGNNAFAVKNRSSTPTVLEWDLRGASLTDRVATSADTLESETWQFVVLAWDGEVASIYVDDMSTPAGGPTAISGSIDRNEQNLVLAARNHPDDVVDRFTNIEIAGLALFDQALDESERKRLAMASHSLDLEFDGDLTWNDDSVTLEGGALRLDDPGPLYDRILEGEQAFSFEMWVRADSTDQTGPARMVSLSQDTSLRNFTVGAEDDAIEVRLRDGQGDNDENGLPAVIEQNDMISTDLEHYVVTLSAGVARLYRNGSLVASVQTAGDLGGWERTFPLLVGNESGLDRPWRGDIYFLAIYDRALSTAEVANHYAAGENPRLSGPLCTVLNPYVATAKQWFPVLLFGQEIRRDDDGLRIVDETGNGHDGALEGNTSWYDVGGPTAALDGYLHHHRSSLDTTVIAHHTDLDITGSHTIAYWRRRHGSPVANHEAEFAKGNDTYQARTYYREEANLAYSLRSPNTDAATDSEPLEMNEWQFVVFLFDDDLGQMEIYVDDMATPVATQGRTSPVSTDDSDLTIASHPYGRHADLDVTGFVVFDRALNETRRQALRDADY